MQYRVRLTSSEFEYCRASMSRTVLRPWKSVLDMGSSCHRGSFIAPDQEVNMDNLGMSLRPSIK